MSEVLSILNKYWGYNEFRPAQEEAIMSVLAGKDTLVLLPTGGGKSICFQVPTLYMKKVTIVVTPLIALMKDQVDQLKKRGIGATAIHSGLSGREIDILLDNCIYGHTQFLYLSPERLKTDLFIARVKQMNVGMIVVDEAHCISQWGYDFRPSYLDIVHLRELLPQVPIMALTATATPDVQNDIQEKLQMKDAVKCVQTFARANLSYSAFEEEEKSERVLKILKAIPGTSIIYVRTRKQTAQIANWLHTKNIRAANYHAGMTLKDREQRQQAWIDNHVQVIVSTNAFGMGIDKPDVRTVIHWDLPDSLEAYYQEAGRAGRDGNKAYAIAFYSRQDLDEMEVRGSSKYPAVDTIKRVYQSLANYAKLAIGGGVYSDLSFSIGSFSEAFKLTVPEVYSSLKVLEQEALLSFNESFSQPSQLMILVSNRELYDFQLKNPDIDTLVRVLLRFYGGEMFSDLVKISEESLAKAILLPPERVQMLLKYLHDSGMVEYQYRSDGPRITFLTPRYDANLLPINVVELEKRKESDKKKVKEVVHYVTHPTSCRTILLLNYFGEEGADYCGICDHCLKRLKQQKGTSDELSQQIKQYFLKNNRATIQELKQAFNQDITQIAVEVAKLVKTEQLVYRDEETLELHK